MFEGSFRGYFLVNRTLTGHDGRKPFARLRAAFHLQWPEFDLLAARHRQRRASRRCIFESGRENN
jgi:hypothetical protein